MADEKAPSIDGFPCEFYKVLWDQIGLDLHEVYLEAFHNKSLGNLINQGNIKFIPKSGDPEDICNWQPIMLFNVSYEIIAKAFALKIRHMLPLVVRLEQTSFIKSRFILDNIIVVWEGMEWACRSHQKAMFSKIDFTKANDCIEWPFILAMLFALGFGPNIPSVY